MGIISPSKFMTRNQLRRILKDNCIGESGQEYCEGELIDLLREKESRLAAIEAEKAFTEYHAQDFDNDGGCLPPLFPQDFAAMQNAGNKIDKEINSLSNIANNNKQPTTTGDIMKKDRKPLDIAAQWERQDKKAKRPKAYGQEKSLDQFEKYWSKANGKLDKLISDCLAIANQ